MGEFDGFFGRVAGKGKSVFRHRRRGWEIFQCEVVESIAQDSADFSEFVRVARGDKEGSHA